eukprot:m51a1_g6139 putative serine threonine protein kinase 15 (172) ;mRNA; f:269217-274632
MLVLPQLALSIKDFKILKPLTKGSVYMVGKVQIRDIFAIKVMSRRSLLHKNNIMVIQNECNILIDIKNTDVIDIYYCFTSKDIVYIVMNKKGKSLTKKPKSSTASADINPTLQSHTELETADQAPEEQADKHKDSKKPDKTPKLQERLCTRAQLVQPGLSVMMLEEPVLPH